MRKTLLFLFSAFAVFNSEAQTVSTVYGTAGTAATSAPPSVVATSATLYSPVSLLKDSNNRMWVVEREGNRLRLFDPNLSPPQAIVRAGKPSSSPGSGNGTGVNASFDWPKSILRLSTGDFLISDANNNCIRQVSMFTNVGTIQTVSDYAGVKSSIGGFKDTLKRFAEFNSPADMAMDSLGNIYVSDAGNHAIRKIAPDSMVTTIAGDGVAGNTNGPLNVARFTNPSGILVLNNNTLLIADQGNQVIRKIDLAAQTVSTYAGDGLNEDDDGPLASASFLAPTGIAMDAYGAIYVSNAAPSHTIRKIANGVVSTFAGSSGTLGSTDGVGSAARFNSPAGLYYKNNELFVCDEGNHTIRKISVAIPTGIMSYSSFSVEVYPNPVLHVLNIQTTTGSGKLTLTDMLGKIVLTAELENGLNEIPVAQLLQGVYLLQVEQNGKTALQKLVKE